MVRRFDPMEKLHADDDNTDPVLFLDELAVFGWRWDISAKCHSQRNLGEGRCARHG